MARKKAFVLPLLLSFVDFTTSCNYLTNSFWFNFPVRPQAYVFAHCSIDMAHCFKLIFSTACKERYLHINMSGTSWIFLVRNKLKESTPVRTRMDDQPCYALVDYLVTITAHFNFDIKDSGSYFYWFCSKLPSICWWHLALYFFTYIALGCCRGPEPVPYVVKWLLKDEQAESKSRQIGGDNVWEAWTLKGHCVPYF